MEKILGLKEFRENLPNYMEQIRKGKSYVVVRRSKPIFRVSPLTDDQRWEEVVDFTKIHKGGVKIDNLLSRL